MDDQYRKLSVLFKGENNPFYGQKHTPEARLKMSSSHKGKTTPKKGLKSPKTAGENNPAKRQEVRAKISQSKKGHIVSNETRIKIANTLKEKLASGQLIHSCIGKRLSKEEKQKLSQAHIGVQAKEKHPLWGKHMPEETKKKLSALWRGDKAPNWKGGISFVPYCHKFNEELKEQIRERDNQACQLCATKENGKRLHVHHIHYDKPNCNPDLISLCTKCHGKANHNRDYWEEYFMKLLKERGLV